VVVPVSLSSVRAPAHPGYPGSKGRKTVVCLFVMSAHVMIYFCKLCIILFVFIELRIDAALLLNIISPRSCDPGTSN